MEKLLTIALEVARTHTGKRKDEGCGRRPVTAPYLANKLSKLTQNQWSHVQQLTLTEDHLSAVDLKPTTNMMFMIRKPHKVGIH